MSYGLRTTDGSAGVPHWSWENDTDTGFYRIGSNNVGAAANGAKVWEWDTNGIALASGKTFEFGDGTSMDTASKLVKLDEIVLSEAQATLPFTSIPATYRSLLVVASVRGDAVSARVNVRFQANSDTGSNYDHQLKYVNDTTFAASNGAATNAPVVGWTPAASSPSGHFGLLKLFIEGYASTAKDKVIQTETAMKAGTAVTDFWAADGWVVWQTTGTAISGVTLTLASGNFDVGCVATLYGVGTV